MFKFIKYQSLGNDFILFDWLDEAKPKFDQKLIQHICDRHFGIGSDGVLIIQKNKNQQLELFMFNVDGTNGGKCLNGIRCAAHYLVKQKNYPAELDIFMGDTLMHCEVTDEVITNLGTIKYQKQHQITVDNKTITGHIVDAGNPHFVIFGQIHGSAPTAAISEHPDFPDRTNVEFVWKENNNFNVVIYERGCGMTLACGTGAAAVMQTLYHLQKVDQNETVHLKMPGGILESYIDKNNNVIQKAPASLVFRGIITWPE